jgi:UDP-N-acetylglucosamine acyltransferase
VKIHPTAVIHPKAVLADDVEVGAYSVVGEHVRIGAGTRVLSHVCIDGWTDIGERCEFHPFVSVGGPPQHMQYKGEPTKVVIGHDNILREYVTVNRATVQGGGLTSVGHSNFLMAYVHVAHDSHLGNISRSVIMPSSAGCPAFTSLSASVPMPWWEAVAR